MTKAETVAPETNGHKPQVEELAAVPEQRQLKDYTDDELQQILRRALAVGRQAQMQMVSAQAEANLAMGILIGRGVELPED